MLELSTFVWPPRFGHLGSESAKRSVERDLDRVRSHPEDHCDVLHRKVSTEPHCQQVAVNLRDLRQRGVKVEARSGIGAAVVRGRGL